MFNRPYVLVVVAFWLMMMAWLAATKILPPILEGERPEYEQELASEGSEVRRSGWKLFWNQRPIGVTVLEATHPEGQLPQVRSVAKINNLSLQRLMEDTLGGMARLWNTIADSEEVNIDLSIATRIHFDEVQQLDHFETTLKMSDGTDVLFASGQVLESARLRIDLRQGGGIPFPQGLMAKDIAIPPDVEFSTLMTPRTTLKGLHVGQKWNIPLINPLAPTASVRVIEALVEAKESVAWHSEPLLVVVYREDRSAGQGTATIVGRSWVAPSGDVLRQEAMMGSLTIRMDRLEGPALEEACGLLESRTYERLMGPTSRKPAREW
jgi:hypothetical protein